MKIGNTIKRLRKCKGYNQSDFASKCGITQSYLSLLENGIKTPSIKVLSFISKNLEIPVPFIIFYAIDDNDVPEGKKSMYKILHPHMKQMIDDIVYGNIPR